MASPPHTMSEEKTSAVDSMASATSAYVLPTSPAISLAAARAALISMPICAERIPRRTSGLIAEPIYRVAATSGVRRGAKAPHSIRFGHDRIDTGRARRLGGGREGAGAGRL